jgi:biofilm protein TabA
MIFDKIENINSYFNNKLPILKIIKDITNESYVFDSNLEYHFDEKIFVKKIEYINKKENWVTESHKKYVDFQFITKGNEFIKVFDIDETLISSPFSFEKDLILYNSCEIAKKSHVEIELKKGYFIVLYPQDVHMTQITTPNDNNVSKYVIKIDYNFLLHNIL